MGSGWVVGGLRSVLTGCDVGCSHQWSRRTLWMLSRSYPRARLRGSRRRRSKSWSPPAPLWIWVNQGGGWVSGWVNG